MISFLCFKPPPRNRRIRFPVFTPRGSAPVALRPQKLMFTPQGIEFCQDHNFPTIEVFRENRGNIQGLEVYVDTGDIMLKGKEYVCLVGDTNATIEASRPQFTHTIILMHGARAKINAKDYAVLNIVNISGEYSVKKDETVIVL